MLSWVSPVRDLGSILGVDNQRLVVNDDGDKIGRKKREKRLWIWKWSCGFMGIFFIAAAYVQHNDPDPYLWIPAYLIPALISWTTALKIQFHSNSRRLSNNWRRTRGNNNINKGQLPKWLLLERLIMMAILYSFFLGIYTLSHYIYINHLSEGPSDESAVLLQTWTSESEMMKEEGKELLGLCLIIAWLSLIKDNNFLGLGRMGLIIGISLTLFPFITWIAVDLIEKELYSESSSENTRSVFCY